MTSVDGDPVAGDAAREDLLLLDEVAGRREQLRIVGELDRRVEASRAEVTLTRRPAVAADDLHEAIDVADLGLALGDRALRTAPRRAADPR